MWVVKNECRKWQVDLGFKNPSKMPPKNPHFWGNLGA